MNFNKGAKTGGRGTSFKGALTYYLHDKDTLETAQRVGFTNLRNLVTNDPYAAWREMMLTAESTDRLKAEAGLKPARKKNEQPVYVFSIEWHPDDNPSKQHMLMAAVDVLRFVKLDEHQAVLVEHTDTAHPHVHITVNMIHPETGRSANLYNDEYRLDRWCDQYELKYGPIRSPARRMKFAALDQGLEAPPKTPQPKHYNNPAVKAAIANDNATAQARARAIQDDFKDHAARLKATQSDHFKRRKNEHRQLWNDYRTARQALWARHQFQIDQIYKHKRNRHALPLSIQGFRDWKETKEWKTMMARLKAEKRRFDYRERTLLGFVSNAIGLIRPGMIRSGRSLLPVLFNLLVSAKARRELLLVKQGLASKALSEKQFGKRKVRADRIRLIRDAQLEALSHAFDIQKQSLDQRHEREIARQKLDWKALSIERKRLWEQWEAEFGQRPRQRQSQGSGGQGGGGGRTATAPKLKSQFPNAKKLDPRGQFADAAEKAKMQPPKATEDFLGAGSPVDRPKPPDSRPKAAFDPAASKNPPKPKPGYKQRRSAAERRTDGSYKPRQRNVPKPKL